MISFRAVLGIGLILLFNSCWKKQDIDINGPDMPTYELYGVVNFLAEDTPVVGLDVSVTQIEVYQGEYLEPMFTETNSIGEYSFPELYRGRYRLRLTQENLIIYERDVGLINFDDREYNIEIPRIIQLLEQDMAFHMGEEARGLTQYSDLPLALTFLGGTEQLRSPELSSEIIPASQSYWMHSGLAAISSSEFASIRRQIDTTIIDGNISVGAPDYYHSTFDMSVGQATLHDASFSGERQHLTQTFDQTGLWFMKTDFEDYKFLNKSDHDGNVQENIPLSGNLAGTFSIIETDSAFLAVDTSRSSIWISSASDSLYGIYEYKVFDLADSLVRMGGDLVKFVSIKDQDHLFIANQSGVYTARILGR